MARSLLPAGEPACPACHRFLSSSPLRLQPALEGLHTNSGNPLPPVSVQPIAGPSKPPPLKPSTAPKSRLKARKAALQLTSEAVTRLQSLLTSPEPQLIRVGVRNKGCAGMSYHLDYVTEPEKFDEVVEQDGVRVVIDSKALFSIIGSVMDWQEDALGAKFVFKNPNIKDACGCGESFIV